LWVDDGQTVREPPKDPEITRGTNTRTTHQWHPAASRRPRRIRLLRQRHGRRLTAMEGTCRSPEPVGRAGSFCVYSNVGRPPCEEESIDRILQQKRKNGYSYTRWLREARIFEVSHRVYSLSGAVPREYTIDHSTDTLLARKPNSVSRRCSSTQD